MDFVVWLSSFTSHSQKLYGNISQHRQEYCQYFLTYHPCPSWLVVANALYMSHEHGALEVLQKFYLKGELKVVQIVRDIVG